MKLGFRVEPGKSWNRFYRIYSPAYRICEREIALLKCSSRRIICNRSTFRLNSLFAAGTMPSLDARNNCSLKKDQAMARVVPTTVGQSLYWSYAQMVMAFASSRHGMPEYQQIDFIIRNKTYRGLLRGSIKLGSMYMDEREKIFSAGYCVYCGTDDFLSLDHLIPRLQNGPDAADNLVTACRSCNSSKGSKDLLEWASCRDEPPTLVLLRRYLKLAIRYCVQRDVMELPILWVDALDPPLPFAFGLIPHELPDPVSLLVRL